MSRRRGGAVVVLAGLEPLGRAGLLVDVETVRAAGLTPVGIATCSTAQDGGKARIEPLPVRLIAEQLRIAFARGDVGAVKVGLVPTSRQLRALALLLPAQLPRVVDPVVRSSTGAVLSSATRRDFLRWAHPSTVLTPNVAELGWLSGAPVTTHEERLAAARALLKAGFGAVVIKGGHTEGKALDHLVLEERVIAVGGTRLKRRPEQRGTGCRFASAYASALAQGASHAVAARRANTFVRRYLATPS